MNRSEALEVAQHRHGSFGAVRRVIDGGNKRYVYLIGRLDANKNFVSEGSGFTWEHASRSFYHFHVRMHSQMRLAI